LQTELRATYSLLLLLILSASQGKQGKTKESESNRIKAMKEEESDLSMHYMAHSHNVRSRQCLVFGEVNTFYFNKEAVKL